MQKNENEMKPWQHGFELEFLKKYEREYEYYNSFTDSPFAKFKKNNIAECLHKKTLKSFVDEDGNFCGAIDVSECKTTSKIYMHGDTCIGIKKPGDFVMQRIVGPNFQSVKNYIANYENKDCWMYVWAEDPLSVNFAEDCGFDKVGVKYTTFAEIYAIYFRPKYNILLDEKETREMPKVETSELYAIKKLNINVDVNLLSSIEQKIKQLDLKFQNHYSNYNKKNSWSALSLRGYTQDPLFITKPEEMNDKWKEEHKNVEFFLQDTPLYEEFSEVRKIVESIGCVPHRVRLMRLKSGGGELERHTDQVDPDAGTKIGRLARLHFPIKTNPDVIFTNWDQNAVAIKSNMKVGECWYLDTRKPHMAVNAGSEERIHLVIDFETTKELQDLING